MADITTIGLIVGISMALIRLLEYGLGLAYKVFVKQTDKGGIDNKQEMRLTKVETLYEEHCKVQIETLATIHNGLNSMAKATTDNTKELIRLGTIIEERIPKK